MDDIELPPLPEWSKQDDLGRLLPSDIRSELRDYARAAIAAYRAAREIPSSGPAPDEEWKMVPVDRSYDMRVKAIIAFNQCKGDRDDALQAAWEAMLAAAPAATQQEAHHGLDNDRQVLFYEQDFYVLSNFSSFNLRWYGDVFPTSEHAYHYEKFDHDGGDKFQLRSLRASILAAPSAHAAFKIAERWKGMRRPDWDHVKVGIMRDILRTKAGQHEYVRRKLLATGDRELIENSWRDDFWGWGPNRDGQNMLGKLWMEVRAELRAVQAGDGKRAAPRRVGAADDCAPDSKGCCGCTVTARCPGCPHEAGGQGGV